MIINNKKKRQSERLSVLPFTVLSVLVHAGGALLGFLLFNLALQVAPLSGSLVVTLAFLPWATELFAQSNLFAWQFDWSRRRWLTVNAVGFFGIILLGQALTGLFGSVATASLATLLLVALPLVPLGIIQAWQLRDYVDRAWLWAIGFPAMASMSFAIFLEIGLPNLMIPDFSFIFDTFAHMVIGGLHGLFIAIMIMLLVRTSQRGVSTLQDDDVITRVNHLEDTEATLDNRITNTHETQQASLDTRNI